MSDLLRFTVDNNDVTFTDEVKSDSESLVKKARLFYVGTHKDRDYSAADLKKVADSFEEVPLQLDHSKSARDTVGIVRKTWLENDGRELHGELEFLGHDPVEKVRLGLWKKVRERVPGRQVFMLKRHTLNKRSGARSARAPEDDGHTGPGNPESMIEPSWCII